MVRRSKRTDFGGAGACLAIGQLERAVVAGGRLRLDPQRARVVRPCQRHPDVYLRAHGCFHALAGLSDVGCDVEGRDLSYRKLFWMGVEMGI
jgi:hypothetical protein